MSGARLLAGALTVALPSGLPLPRCLLLLPLRLLVRCLPLWVLHPRRHLPSLQPPTRLSQMPGLPAGLLQSHQAVLELAAGRQAAGQHQRQVACPSAVVQSCPVLQPLAGRSAQLLPQQLPWTLQPAEIVVPVGWLAT